MSNTLREKALSKLSISALVIDFLVVVAVWKLIQDFIPFESLGLHKGEMELWSLGGIPLLLIVHLFIGEVIFCGMTIGRVSCGITVVHRDPTRSTVTWRIKRFFSILMRFGLASLNPSRLPAYHVFEDLHFSSDLVGSAPARATPNSRSGASRPPASAAKHAQHSHSQFLSLDVISGPHMGASISLQSGRSISQDGTFRIGRDRNWADLVLSNDQKVSARHCRLQCSQGKVSIADGAEPGADSTNGTAIDGIMLPKGYTPFIHPNQIIRVGVSQIRIRAS